MTKRHHGNRTLQEEIAASSYILTIPRNKRPGKTWRALYRQRRMRIEPPQRVWRRGGPITEYAYRLGLHIHADVCPNAAIIADGVCGRIRLTYSLGGIGATRSSYCGAFHVEHNRLESLVAKEGGEYVSRETLGTAAGGTVDETQTAAGDLSRKIRWYGQPRKKRTGVCGAKHRRWKWAPRGE